MIFARACRAFWLRSSDTATQDYLLARKMLQKCSVSAPFNAKTFCTLAHARVLSEPVSHFLQAGGDRPLEWRAASMRLKNVRLIVRHRTAQQPPCMALSSASGLRCCSAFDAPALVTQLIQGTQALDRDAVTAAGPKKVYEDGWSISFGQSDDFLMFRCPPHQPASPAQLPLGAPPQWLLAPPDLRGMIAAARGGSPKCTTTSSERRSR